MKICAENTSHWQVAKIFNVRLPGDRTDVYNKKTIFLIFSLGLKETEKNNFSCTNEVLIKGFVTLQIVAQEKSKH